MFAAYNEEVCCNRLMLEFDKRLDVRLAALGLGPPPAAKAQVGVVTDVALCPNYDEKESAHVADHYRAEATIVPVVIWQAALAEIASSRKNGAWFPCGEASGDAHDAPLPQVAVIDKRATEAEVLTSYYTGADAEHGTGGVGSDSVVKLDASGVDCDDTSDGNVNFDGETETRDAGFEHHRRRE